MTDNMALYNEVREVPQSAVKKISGGSYGAAGLSDINPQWRIEVMTRMFGPVGTGWTWEPVDCFERENVLYAHVVVRYLTESGEWSQPIHGYGGTKFGGRDDSDIYKSTITDAVSNALRFLGVGADVWYNAKRPSDKNQFDTKYSAPPAQKDALDDELSAGPQPLSVQQRNTLRAMLEEVEWAAMEQKYGKNLALMKSDTYVTVLAKIKERKANEGKTA